MKKQFPIRAGLWLLICFVTAATLSGLPAVAQAFPIPGTGACEPLLAELAEAFNRTNPAVAVTVPPSTGSGGGIDAVLKDAAPLARVARTLKDGEIKQELVRQVFARDTVAFVAGREVKITSLSPDQLVAIFSGKIRNWREFGKQEATIRVITREPGDSSLIVIQEHLAGFRDIVFTPQAKVIMYDKAAVEALDKFKNAIGFATLSSLKWSKGGLRPLSLDGVAPTRENILAGTYRLVEDYAFVFKKNLTPAAKKFVDFVFSPEGRRVIELNGLIASDGK